jgi:hypothetical protein
MVITTGAVDAQMLDSLILSIQHETDRAKQTAMLNDLLVSREKANHRIAVAIMRSRAKGTPLEDVEQTVREVCSRMVLGMYKPFAESTKFDHQLLVKAGDRVLMMRRLTTNRVASGMGGVAIASVRCAQVKDELITTLKREPSRQEIKQRYLDLYGADAPDTALVANIATKVSNSDTLLEEVSIADQGDFGDDHYVRIEQEDGTTSSVELSDVVALILGEAAEIDPSGALSEYIKAWLESEARGEPKSQRAITVMASKIGLPYRELLSKRVEEQRDSIFKKVLTKLGVPS